MKNLQQLFFIVHLCVAVAFCLAAVSIDDLVATSNIYYQQPLHNNEAHEYPMDSVDRLPSKRNIKLVIHGWASNRFSTSIIPLRNAYMAQRKENIFLADWSAVAAKDYFTAREVIAKVGIFLAQLLEAFSDKLQIPLSEIHIIGHSLGAHIAGNMGRYFNGSVGRVTGLDPALPLFEPNDTDSLQSTNALFVDVIHTGYPLYGDDTARGVVDFYPNYGKIPQKGCDDIASTAKFIAEGGTSCSHRIAVNFYAESIGAPKQFPAIPCSLAALKNESSSTCLNKWTDKRVTKLSLAEDIARENDQGDTIAYMGEGASKSATGLYYLATNDVTPYGLGLYTQVP